MTAAPFLLLLALRDPSPVPDVAGWLRRIGHAEAAGFDGVVLDGFPLDSMLLAALAATRTTTVGLLPVLSATVSEPFHVSTRLATLDFASAGRAGWVVTTTPSGAAAGAVTWDVADDVEADAAEHVEAVRALWDSWEDGAEVRDDATARFLDRSKVHHVRLRGRHLAVRGPSITPRPPQGHPVVVSRDPAIPGVDVLLAATPVVGRRWVLDAGGADAPGAVDAAARAAADGAQGVLVDGTADLDGLATTLTRRGVRAAGPAMGTLRERFGLAPAANRYAPRPR